MQVLTRIEASFGRRLALDVIIASPTVRELALRLTARGSPDGSSLLALRVQGSRPPFFWVHGEKSNLFLPRVLGPDQPLYGLASIPPGRRPAYIEAIYRRAGRRYVPAVFPGRVVLLKTSASSYEPERVWARLAAGGRRTSDERRGDKPVGRDRFRVRPVTPA